MVARLSKIVHHGTAVMDENLLRVGAMEIDLGYVQSPSKLRVATTHPGGYEREEDHSRTPRITREQ
jgi:hypothetical protein